MTHLGATNRPIPVVGGEPDSADEREKTSAVRMSVPADPTSDSTLSINFGGPAGSQIIRELTGVELQVIDGVQHVRLQNGIRVIPFPFMRLDGFTDEGIDRVFPTDNKIAAALRKGDLYAKEKIGESVPRSCVSFVISAQPDADVILELVLGRELSDKIQKDLFR